MGRAMAAVAAALAVLPLAACGDSGPQPAESHEGESREAVKVAAERFAEVVSARDAGAFCALLSADDKARLAGGRNDGEGRCLVVWGRRHNPFFGIPGPDLAFEEIVKLEPPTAVVRLGGGGRLVLAEEEGAWRISLAPEAKGSQR